MTTSTHLRIGTAMLLSLVASIAAPQPGPWHETSLEVTVLDADAVAVGTLVEYKLGDDVNTIVEATVAISEKIKGELPSRVTVPVNRTFRSFLGWSEGKAKVLVTRTGGELRLMSLSVPTLLAVRADFRLVRGAENIIAAAREIVKSAPGVTSVETMQVSVPPDVVKAFPQTGMGMYIDVPIDSRLERWAQAAIESNSGSNKAQAATALGFFKSERNTLLLKGLLNDPTVAHYDLPNGHLGKGRRTYHVRRAAFDALTKLGVKVDEPTLEEVYDDPDAVTYVYLERASDLSAIIGTLSRFKNLTDLYLSHTSMTDEDVRTIARLPHIKKLELNDTPITDAALAEIGRMKELEILSLGGTKITTAGVRSLLGLSNLQYLDLNRTLIDDAALPELVKITSLRSLGLGRTNVTPRGLLALRPLTNLEVLEMALTTDEHFSALREAGLLHAFSHAYGEGDKRVRSDDEVTHVLFFSEPVTDAGLANFSVFRNLRRLSISSPKVSDEGMKTVAGFRQLTDLLLNDTQITDAGLRTLAGLTSIESLGLAKTKITDAGMGVVGGMTRLKWLVLGGTAVTDAGLAKLKGLKSLETLLITDMNVTDAGIKHLVGLPKLATVSISGSKVTDSGVLALAKMPSLRSLNLWRVPGVSHETLVKIRRLRPDLEIQH
jgi:Leucine-rich repeat (LRR) protein